MTQYRIEELSSDRRSLATFMREKLGTDTVGMEVGVLRGRFAAILIEVMLPKTLHLVDPWLLDDQPGTLDSEAYDEAVETVQAACDAFSTNIAENPPPTVLFSRKRFEDFDELAPGSLDWIYVDAYHSYDHVRPQLDKAVVLVRPGGIIAGHDFRVEPRDWRTGVSRAVLELVFEQTLKPLAITNEVYASYVCERMP